MNQEPNRQPPDYTSPDNRPQPSQPHGSPRASGPWSGQADRAYYRQADSPQVPHEPSGSFSDGPDGSDWQNPYVYTPSQFVRMRLKKTVRRIVPALLILFLVENIAASVISALINIALAPRIQLEMNGIFQFPADTYYGMRYGLYTLLTSYLPVVVGEIAAILYLRPMSGIPFKKLFARPLIPFSGASGNGSVYAYESGTVPERKRLPGWAWVLFAAVAGIGFSMIGQILALFEINLLYSIDFPLYSPDFSTNGYALIDTVLINLYVCVLGPVLEELIFRGFLLKTTQRHGVSFAAVFTAILFAMYHMNLVQLFVPLLMGLFLAQLTIRTDSILPAICCHMLNNTLSTIIELVAPTSDIWSFVFLVVECAVFIGLLAIFWIFYGREFSPILKWRSPHLSLSAQVGAAFATWPVILFTVFYFGMLGLSTLFTFFGYY